MKNLVVLSCLVALSMVPKALASGENHSSVVLESGKRDFNACYWETDNSNPDCYDLYRLDTSKSDLSTNKIARLLVKQNSVRINVFPTATRFLDLTTDSATKLFGEPFFQGQSKRDPSLGLLIYQLKGFGPPLNELAVFNIEIEIGKDGTFKDYRVQGHGIKNADWQVM
jgi:hypothetical protein